MIRSNAYGLSPKFDISIDSAPIDYMALNAIEVHLAEGMHDMVILRMAGIPVTAMQLYRNKAVQLRIDTGASYVHDFVGYVSDVRPEAVTAQGVLNNSPFQNVDIVCLGASYAMRGPKAHVYTDLRLQDVATTLATKYGFSLDVPADPLIKSPLIQQSESDWQFLVRYARSLGYCVTLHGTNLHIFDPHKAVGRAISFNRLFTAKNINAQTIAQPGQITRLRASLAERHADGVYKDSVVTVQQSDTLSYDVSTSELRGLPATARFTDRLDDTAQSFYEAARIIETRSKDEYDYYATAEVMGVAGCKPGGVVDVNKYQSQEMDGLWYVQSVKHSLTSGSFTSELGLAKNINSELTTAAVQAFQQPSVPTFTNGSWGASRRTINVY